MTESRIAIHRETHKDGVMTIEDIELRPGDPMYKEAVVTFNLAKTINSDLLTHYELDHNKNERTCHSKARPRV